MAPRNNPPHRRRAQDFLPGRTPDHYDGPCTECLILWSRHLTGYLLARGYSRDDAIDVVQSTIASAIEALSRPEPADLRNHRAWLWGVLRITAAAALREKLKYGPAAADVHAAPPSDEADRRDTVRAVRAAVDKLYEPSREVLNLHLDGLTYGEVAARLGITPAAVKHRLARARQELGDQLLASGFQADEFSAELRLR